MNAKAAIQQPGMTSRLSMNAALKTSRTHAPCCLHRCLKSAILSSSSTMAPVIFNNGMGHQVALARIELDKRYANEIHRHAPIRTRELDAKAWNPLENDSWQMRSGWASLQKAMNEGLANG
jgi:hypothetical protein